MVRVYSFLELTVDATTVTASRQDRKLKKNGNLNVFSHCNIVMIVESDHSTHTCVC